jgi:hypothetical protein
VLSWGNLALDTAAVTLIICDVCVGKAEAGSTAVVWQDSFSASVLSDNGDGRGSEAQSVYLSAKFISAVTTLPENTFRLAAANATRYSTAGAETKGGSRYLLRFLIMPETAHTFHVADAFFNRFPKASA